MIYTGSSIGSILGGWLSGATDQARLARRQGAHDRPMLLAAIFMPGSIFAYYADSFGACVAFITLATACHQAWSANLFTNATDMFPGKVAGSVVGLGATAGGIGGMFMTLLAGLAVQWTGNQQIVFVWAGGMHLLALALFWFWFKATIPAGERRRGQRRDRSRTVGLVAAGSAVTAFGLALSALVYTQLADHGRGGEGDWRCAGGGCRGLASS